MSEVIQFNMFSALHNGKNIFFCKTDFLDADFDYIKKLSNDVIMISGNSDFSVTDDLADSAPKNIKKWFCQNNISSHVNLISLPMGVENCFESKRSGHGVGWNFALEKNRILSSLFCKKITGEISNLIYANFNVNTNLEWRSKIKKACLKLDYITFQDSNLDYPEFISNILSHEAVVCPIGNAPNGEGDNHRVHEVLYSNRIPIVFSYGQKTIYEKLYKFLPVVLLEDERELLDKEHIIKQINIAKEKGVEKIKFSHWEKEIKREREKQCNIIG